MLWGLMLWLLGCAPEPAIVDGSNSVKLDGVEGVSCTLRADDREVHRAEVGDDGIASLHGLLADEVYDCSAVGLLFEATTEPLPEWIPPITLSGDPEASTGTYTLFQHFLQDPGNGVGLNGQALIVVDREGRVRWYHRLNPEIGVTDASFVGDGRVLYGGRNGQPTLVSLSGEKLSTWDISGQHHDVEMLPSGRVAALVYVKYADSLGFGVKIVDPETGELSYDLRSDELDLAEPEPVEGQRDLFHANALRVEERHGEPVRIWVNLRHTSQLIRIEPRARVIDLDLGPDSAWTMEGDWWEGPHDPQWKGDRLLVYDNGDPDRGSRIQEVLLDEADLQAVTSWTWTPGWYEEVWGGVVYLPEDHVLVTRGHCRSCSDEGQSALIEVNPEGEIVWQLDFDPLSGLYRSQALGGCEIFSNRLYCPE